MTIILWLLKQTKTEVKIVLVSLAVLVFLPAISVVVIAASGVQLVGDALAALNPITHLVEIFDTEGNKIGEVELTTNWPARGVVSDEFGSHQQFRKDWGFGPHSGIDVANVVNEPITPFMEGEVIYIDNVDDSACGKHVKLQHNYNITSIYCHMNQTVDMLPGTPVKPGDIIGYMGETGAATGIHVHLSIYIYGIAVNPRAFLVGEPVAGSAIKEPIP